VLELSKLVGKLLPADERMRGIAGIADIARHRRNRKNKPTTATRRHREEEKILPQGKPFETRRNGGTGEKDFLAVFSDPRLSVLIRGEVLQSFDGLNGHSIDFTRSRNLCRPRLKAAIEGVSLVKSEGARHS
jgi:hypothetical protein